MRNCWLRIVLITLLAIFCMPAGLYAEDPILITIDGREVRSTDVAPILVNGRVMVPLRMVSEALGCEVTWVTDVPGVREVRIRTAAVQQGVPKPVQIVGSRDFQAQIIDALKLLAKEHPQMELVVCAAFDQIRETAGRGEYDAIMWIYRNDPRICYVNTELAKVGSEFIRKNPGGSIAVPMVIAMMLAHEATHSAIAQGFPLLDEALTYNDREALAKVVEHSVIRRLGFPKQSLAMVREEVVYYMSN